MAGWLHRYVDWITRVVLDAHEAERKTLVEQNATDVSRFVHRVLDLELALHLCHVLGPAVLQQPRKMGEADSPS